MKVGYKVPSTDSTTVSFLGRRFFGAGLPFPFLRLASCVFFSFAEHFIIEKMQVRTQIGAPAKHEKFFGRKACENPTNWQKKREKDSNFGGMTSQDGFQWIVFLDFCLGEGSNLTICLQFIYNSFQTGDSTTKRNLS